MVSGSDSYYNKMDHINPLLLKMRKKSKSNSSGMLSKLLISKYLGAHSSTKQLHSGKGEFETYAQRRLEMLGSYRNRRQTESNFLNFECKRRSPDLLLQSTSSQKREPVSHKRGAFKAALKVCKICLKFYREGDKDQWQCLYSIQRTLT